MTINGKTSGITTEDMLACGNKMELKALKCKKIIKEVQGVVKQWQDIAHSVGIRKKPST